MKVHDVISDNGNNFNRKINGYTFKNPFENKKFRVIEGDRETSLGWGISYKDENFVTHSKLPLSKSSFITLIPWQKNVLFTFLAILLLGSIINFKVTLVVLIAILSFIYFSDFLFSFYVLLKSLDLPPEIKFKKSKLLKLSDDELPVYSILCPLYKEEKVLPQFLKAIDSINWPKNKLDVLLLLEEDDKATLAAAGKINLPDYVRVLVVPHSLPKTKPKACNYGLAYAKGEFVVVYDAEDKPDPLQLRKAYLAFKRLPDQVACLQSKLNYYNSEQNLLTRLFTAEYSLWFDLILPGLQSVESIIPLGGTSNHFRTEILRNLHGWDAFNVTEDCDLGTRLFKMGYKTEIIDSTTYEEANSKIKSWIKQRSRWIKGYLQTYLVHMRDPLNFFRVHGSQALIFQLIIGMRMVFILINPILWLTTVSYFVFNPLVGDFIESLYPAPVFYIAVFALIFGNFLHFFNYMIGCAKRGYWEIVEYVFLIPFYWMMTSVASCVAFYQLAVKPHFWEKTEHGLHLARPRPALAEVRLSFELDTKLPRLTGDLIRRLFSPLSVIGRNIMDLIDVFGPLPDLNPREGIKILILNWRDTKHVWAGGAEVYVQEVAKRWVEQGHNVTLFCGWDGKVKREEKIDGVNVIRRGGFYSVYPLAALYYLLRFRGKFDVIVDCENGIPFFSPLYAGIPKILLIHHVHQEVFRKQLSFPLSKIALYLESELMPYVYQNTKIATVSESSKKDIIEQGWANDRDVWVINPGVSLGRARPYPKTQNPSFLYLGRLKAYKNIDIVIKAFAKLTYKYPEARLTIAGFGESFSKLTRLAKSLGLANSVNLAGRVSEEEKTKLLSESWICLQPSSFEGWGITVIEANACGTPVIASDVKGLRDSVKDDLTGYLVEPKNAGVLADAMEYLIINADERKRLEENCLYWSRNFSWDKSAWEFLSLINIHLGEEKELSVSLERLNS
jgi:glycosyltransferase XagB